MLLTWAKLAWKEQLEKFLKYILRDFISLNILLKQEGEGYYGHSLRVGGILHLLILHL
jgi:aminoglycoside/choline kinase family phosphotransferase